MADLGFLSLEPEKLKELIPEFIKKFHFQEFFILNTCNRVEIIYVRGSNIQQEFSKKAINQFKERLKNKAEEKQPLPTNNNSEFINQSFPFLENADISLSDSISERVNLQDLIFTFNPKIPLENATNLENTAIYYKGEEALNHLMRVSCSLESMVVGEKEILAQLRSAYDLFRKESATGEILRLVMDRVVKTAKEIYTQTKISQKPISVVSIAFRKLMSLNIPLDAEILMIGSGKTNILFSTYLLKNGFHNFTVFNRTFSGALSLAKELKGQAFPLFSLKDFKKPFDILIICTSSSEPIITPQVYKELLGHSGSSKLKKVLIDLSVPTGISFQVVEEYENQIYYIDIKGLQMQASENMNERYKELIEAEKIIKNNLIEFKAVQKNREIELAMKDIPIIIKELKEFALSNIFANDINRLDKESQDILKKVLDYMEKKYISIPMVMAKEILVHY